jgi:capsular polysaccharide biosynthesis protein
LNGRRYTAPVGTGSEPDIPAEASGGEYVISLEGILQVVRRRLWVILLVAAVLAGAAVGYSRAQTPIYEASIKILVGQQRGDQSYVGTFDLQQLTGTMAEGIDSRPIAQAVIQQLGLRITPEGFLGRLSVEQIPETQFIEVYYTDSSPERAQRVANTIGEVFSKQVSEVSPSASNITATLWERAVLPEAPVSPTPVRDGILALMVGLVLGGGLALLLEYLDPSWRSPEEAERISGVPTFGVIPEFQAYGGKKGR